MLSSGAGKMVGAWLLVGAIAPKPKRPTQQLKTSTKLAQISSSLTKGGPRGDPTHSPHHQNFWLQA
ncbi:MAG: hypothetical protein AAF889_07965 [Cyanobacteria bacterium P01_D01_bin.73]